MSTTVSVLPEIYEEELTEFRMGLGGQALRPGDAGYELVRPSFGAMYADRLASSSSARARLTS